MKADRALTWGAFAVLGVFLLIRAGSVPFHPDETSLLFQSRDLEALFSDPLSLAFEPGVELERAGQYRALNAPLPKYVLGLGRRAAGYGPASVSRDWDWSRSWEENVQVGALPPMGAVLGARIASALVLALSLVAMYFAGAALDGKSTGLTAALLLGTNALALVHGRRAMAEGTLILGVSLAFLAAIHARRWPWLVGLAAAAALSAKHSALPIAAVALAASTGVFSGKIEGAAQRTLKAGLGFLATVLLLNPFLWKHPLAGSVEIVTSRQDLLRRQTQITDLLAPYGSLDSISERLASLLGNLFILPPQFQEIGNYHVVLEPAIQAYLSNPMHNLLRGPVFGAILLTLAVTGFIHVLRTRPGPAGAAAILGTATLLQVAVLVIANPLPVQRYYMPLLPLVILGQAVSLVEFSRRARQLVSGEENGGS